MSDEYVYEASNLRHAVVGESGESHRIHPETSAEPLCGNDEFARMPQKFREGLAQSLGLQSSDAETLSAAWKEKLSSQRVFNYYSFTTSIQKSCMNVENLSKAFAMLDIPPRIPAVAALLETYEVMWAGHAIGLAEFSSAVAAARRSVARSKKKSASTTAMRAGRRGAMARSGSAAGAFQHTHSHSRSQLTRQPVNAHGASLPCIDKEFSNRHRVEVPQRDPPLLYTNNMGALSRQNVTYGADGVPSRALVAQRLNAAEFISDEVAQWVRERGILDNNGILV